MTSTHPAAIPAPCRGLRPVTDSSPGRFGDRPAVSAGVRLGARLDPDTRPDTLQRLTPQLTAHRRLLRAIPTDPLLGVSRWGGEHIYGR